MRRNPSLAAAAFLLATIASPGWAQQAAPPTDMQVEQARAQAAEAQSTYLMAYLRKQQAEFAAQRQAEAEKAAQTAAWWAEVWQALPPK